jgi:YidC/Oxa1 family membrane protein insertase
MFKFIADVLAFLYELVPSYGGAIMLLTLAIMVVLTPLTLKGTRSMLAMQRLQPELRKLQVKYKDDREKLNQEMMAFYKENNINPVGGCLPLLIQMPVFFVLYRVLFGLTRRAPYGYDLGSAYGMEIAGQGAFERFGDFQPEHVNQNTDLYRDLSATNRMSSFGMDLAESAQKILSSEGFVHALPYIVLVLIVAATSYIQQKQVSGRQQAGGAPNPMNQQQQMLLKIMPLFFVFISFTLPAGIVLYFVVSNLYRVGQQAFITRTMYADAGGKGAVIETTASEVKPAGPGGIKGFLASLAPPKDTLPDPKGTRRKSTKSAAGGSKNANQKRGQATKGGASKAGAAKGGGAKNGARTTKTPVKAAAKGQPTKGAAATAKGAAASKRTTNVTKSSPTAETDTSAGPKGAPPAASKGQAPSRQQRPATTRSQPRKKRK